MECPVNGQSSAVLAGNQQTTFLQARPYGLCCPMENDSPHPHAPDLSGTLFDFTPVPFERRRGNGWTAEAQRRFIHALSVMGSVGAAARAVGIGRASAYRLYDRAIKIGGDAESFAAAWDHALHAGRWRQYDLAMSRAVGGVTTIQVHRSGSVSVRGGADMRLVNAALREVPVPPNRAP
jgi:hypothetical protein